MSLPFIAVNYVNQCHLNINVSAMNKIGCVYLFLLHPKRYCNFRFFSTLPQISSFLPKNEGIQLRHVDVVHKFTGCNTDKVKLTLSRYLKLQLQDARTINYKISLLKEMELEDQYSLKVISLLTFNSCLLNNRYQQLREYGFLPYKLSSHHIRRFIAINKMQVRELKNMELIERDHNVIENLWSVANLKPESCPKVSDNMSLIDIKEITVKAFLREKLEFSEDELESNGNHIVRKLKYKSFQTMNTNHRLFKDVMGLSLARLRKNWFIYYYDHDNVVELLEDVKEVGNVDMKLILHIFPKIAGMPANNMKLILKHFQEYGIPISAVTRSLKIFTLNSETVRSRLGEMKNYEFFMYNIKNPRIVDMIHHQVKIKKRLQFLEDMRLFVSVGGLGLSDKNFEIYCQSNLRPSGLETLLYLSSELGLQKEDILKQLRRHSRWAYVPIVNIGKNLKFLRTHFTDEEIKRNICALFYYSERLIGEMNRLNDQNILDEFKSDGLIKKEHALPLVLYFLEKETNFTGESIWEAEINPYQDLPDRPLSFK